jgi:hypothetical protein
MFFLFTSFFFINFFDIIMEFSQHINHLTYVDVYTTVNQNFGGMIYLHYIEKGVFSDEIPVCRV